MPGLSTIKYYWNLYRLRQRGLEFSKDYQAKLYNWFPPFLPQDLWLSRFIEGRGLLKGRENLKVGIFTVNGKRAFIKYQPCNLKIFFARENLALRPEWHDYMLNSKDFDLAIGFDDIKDNPRYIKIPFWITWALGPLDTYDDICQKIVYLNSLDNKSYSDRKFCAFLCSHGDEGRKRIFKELSYFGKIDSAGRWMHNDESLKRDYFDDKVRWLHNYRFNLTPENSNSPGYVTEKLLEAIQGGCVPIYWGGCNRPEPEIFNQEAIIFIEMGTENTDAVKLVADLNADEKRYMDFACQKRFLPGAEDVIWGYYEELEKRIKEIIKNV